MKSTTAEDGLKGYLAQINVNQIQHHGTASRIARRVNSNINHNNTSSNILYVKIPTT